jgi:hypothetical protein
VRQARKERSKEVSFPHAVYTIMKNTETLIDASKEVGLEVIIGKTKYMFLSCHHNVCQNWDVKIANRSFENVSQFRYLGMKVTN